MIHEALIFISFIMPFFGGGIHTRQRQSNSCYKKSRRYGSGHKEEGITGAEIIIL